jgi:hypothetical protein
VHASFPPLQRTQGWGTLGVGGANKVPVLGRCLDMKERRSTIEENRRQQRAILRKRLAKAQQLLQKRVPSTVSLVDELIAERREESRQDSGPSS